MKKIETLGKKLSIQEQKSIKGGVEPCAQDGETCGLVHCCPGLFCCRISGTSVSICRPNGTPCP